jgi:hypothetical protein
MLFMQSAKYFKDFKQVVTSLIGVYELWLVIDELKF